MIDNGVYATNMFVSIREILSSAPTKLPMSTSYKYAKDRGFINSFVEEPAAKHLR